MLSYQVAETGRPLARVLRDTPEPMGTEVIVRVGACGVCHSDVHLHDGYFDLGGGKRLETGRMIDPPRTLGHEIAGVVVAIGPEASDVAIGDRRVVYPWIGCGRCAVCASGEEQMCAKPAALGINRDGGFADHVVVPHPRYLFAYDPLPEEQACTYACSGLTAYGALAKCRPLAADDPLLIIGAGGVGLSGIRLARQLFGIAPIVAEVDRSKWDTAREAGAGDVIDPTEEGGLKALVKASGGVAAAVDFVGAGPSFAFGFGALRKSGKLVCVGLFGGATSIVPMMVTMKAVTIVGSYVGSPKDMAELMRIARAGDLPAMPVTTQPLDRANDALADLAAGRIRGRTVLRP
jgi:D-arabinose 1-dehydrogenase-like Zn-dependent alcohol dehydrogenase